MSVPEPQLPGLSHHAGDFATLDQGAQNLIKINVVTRQRCSCINYMEHGRNTLDI